MKSINTLLFLAIATIFTACSVEPVPIEYGQDACNFCKMNIVDRQHAAEIVTTKGKAFKYDAIECMMQDLKNWPEADIAFYLMTDYDTPGKLIDATKGNYLISEGIPSPMGANLTGFESLEKATQVHAEKGGELLNWMELKAKIN